MAINENQAKSFIKLFDILAPSQTYEHPNLDECIPVVLWPNQKVTLEYTGGRGVKKNPPFLLHLKGDGGMGQNLTFVFLFPNNWEYFFRVLHSESDLIDH